MTTLTLKKTVEAMHQDQQGDAHTWKWLLKTYPQLFNQPVPLKIGVRADLARQLPESVTRRSLARAISSWCHSKAYQEALAAGGARHGLEGPSGVVTPRQQTKAVGKLNNC